MPGLIRGVARTAVIAGTATAVSNNVSRRQAGRWAQQSAQQAPPSVQYREPPEPAPTMSAEDDMLAQPEKLGALRDSGVLTDEEFAAQKARILAG